MAGWLKKKRMGGNVQKLWEDKDAYGKGLHDKLFNEEVEDDEDEVEEGCEINRIAELMSPDGGGSLDDEDDYEDDEKSVTIKIEDGEEDEELDEGAALDALKSIFRRGATNPEKVLRDKAAREMIQKILARTDKEIGTGTISPDKQVGSAKQLSRALSMGEDDNQEDLKESSALSDLKIVDKVLSALGETPLQGLVDILTLASSVMKGGEEKQKTKTLLMKLRAEAQARGNPLAEDNDEDDDDLQEDNEKDLPNDPKTDDSELEEGITGLGGALSRIANALTGDLDSESGKKKAKKDFRKVMGKTGIGTPASDKLALAGDDEDDELDEANMTQIGKHKTKVKKEDGKTIVTYHNTDVVTFDSQEIVLNSDGYKTLTTKVRMNQTSNEYGLGYTVYQRQGNWFVDYADKTIPFEDDELTLPRKNISFNDEQ